MKFTIIFLVLIVYKINAQTSMIETISRSLIKPRADLCTAKPDTYDICSNCNNIVTCFSFGGQLEKSCSSKSPKTPFCDANTNKCVEKNTCGQTAKVDCKYRGFLPNPMNCEKFIYCEDNAKPPQFYDCPPNTKYNHEEQTCTVNTSCNTFSPDNGLCVNKYSNIVTYPGDAGVFSICPPKGEVAGLITCPLKTDVLNLETFKCEPGCKSSGILKINETHFSMCYKDKTEYKNGVIACSTGTKFDDTLKFCKNP